MPLTALLGEVTLDSTLGDALGDGVQWEDVHRVRPRPQLTCRGCEGSLHAKRSPAGLKFFAHDTQSSDCPLQGESMAHRLLKAALAGAVRAAGWAVELEAAGEGWRADVLATSPDGTKRFAWEAQLSSITPDEIVQRTKTLWADGMRVCWVTDRDTEWLGVVPALKVESSGTGVLVVEGIRRFPGEWCTDREWCEQYEDSTVPCPGHSRWAAPATPVTLDRAVEWALYGELIPAKMRYAIFGKRSYRTLRSQDPVGWTHPTYLQNARAQEEAEERAERAVEETSEAEDAHWARINDLVNRQTTLAPYVAGIVRRKTRRAARVLTMIGEGAPEWAMGVPVGTSADRIVRAVVCPVASRIDRTTAEKLSQVEIVVADPKERDRVAKRCHKDQKIRVVGLSRLGR